MPVMIGAKPDSGFDDPIGMLKDCHRRIESFLGILCLVCRRASGRSLSGEERDAVEAALRYFDVSGPRHNADEEESVFPRLRAHSSAVLEDVHRLEADHRDAEKLHNQVASLYRAWIADAALDPASQQLLLECTDKLERIYRDHIRLEEEVVFPRASEVFDKATLQSVGTEFKARRSQDAHV